jgi:voltage-gated potassium channel
MPASSSIRDDIRNLYEGDSITAQRFRYGLLIFDVATILFLIASSFLHWGGTEYLDYVIGSLILADVIARVWISNAPWKTLLHPFGLLDLVVVVSLLAPLVGEGLAFLRVARTVRLLRSYQLLHRLRKDFTWFVRHEQTVLSALNLGIFIFIMTAIVYETQHKTTPDIANYADALYFTVSALTTTGFGDIVLPGTSGRMIAIVIMTFGVSLFLRLIQVMLRPTKILHKCSHCGLKRHEVDAVHCKACGNLLNIEDEGSD